VLPHSGAEVNRTAFSAISLPILFGGLLFLYALPSSQPAPRVPSNVAWTEETLAETSSGNAFRGLLLAKQCEHCHGSEGFSANGQIPNLAGMDRLSLWKQMDDFAWRKRNSAVMSRIAGTLNRTDFADLAAYYSALPASLDPWDKRVFPQALPTPAQSVRAGQLIVLGDVLRGIPPCQSCHGPVGFNRGAPDLSAQNGEYVFSQLRDFGSGSRANDINMPMRSIAGLLSEDEQHALAAYYGSGLGKLPAGAVLSR
jgi:cytochrome c553